MLELAIACRINGNRFRFVIQHGTMCLTPKMDTISQEQDFPDVGHAELLKTAHALGKAERLMDAAQVLCEIEGLIKSTLEKATGEGTTSMQQECLSKFEVCLRHTSPSPRHYASGSFVGCVPAGEAGGGRYSEALLCYSCAFYVAVCFACACKCHHL